MAGEAQEEIDPQRRGIIFKNPSSVADPFVTIPVGRRQVAISICHQLPERSIHFKGRPIICYRCAGIYLTMIGIILYQIIGFILGFTLLFGSARYWFVTLTRNNILIQLGLVIGLHLPMVIDGMIQAWNDYYESRNWLRFLTGMVAGVGHVTIFLLIGSVMELIF